MDEILANGLTPCVMESEGRERAANSKANRKNSGGVFGLNE